MAATSWPPAACFSTNPAAPTLTVIKHVQGGGASAGRWSLHVQNESGAEVVNSPQAGSESGTTYTLSGGTYAVSETGESFAYITAPAVGNGCGRVKDRDHCAARGH